MMPMHRMPMQRMPMQRMIAPRISAQRSLNIIESDPFASEQDLSKIWDWNANIPEARERCVHEDLSSLAREQPGEAAICAWDGHLTYAELDDHSTRLAHRLIDAGVSRGSIVALCFEKSMWTSVAMLSVMKAGAASVAMDTTQPEERLQSIVQQASPNFILSSNACKELAHRLGGQSAPVCVVDRALFTQLTSAPIRSLPEVHHQDLLYIVFTSGSTGTPKGVTISHCNVSSAMHHQGKMTAFCHKPRIFDFASYAFDVCWGNLYLALTTGGCLCVPSQKDLYGDISGSMHQLGVTYAHLTPTVARSLDPCQLPTLQVMNLGGEAVLETDMKCWTPHVSLIITYGPSECTVSSTLETIDPQRLRSSIIGRGCGANTWVVSTETPGQLSPIGEIGELYLEGPLVGPGYLNDPDKTAAAFVTDPPWLLNGCSVHPGRRGRLYKTGDLVRFDTNGSLIFVGRKDTQVKIRGQRVELNEIEHQIAKGLNTTTETLIVADVIHPQHSTSPLLVAFVSIESCQDETAAREAVQEMTGGLEKQLRSALPIYMIPNIYIPVTTMPITATGKLDRRKLRAFGENFTLEELLALDPSHSKKRTPENSMEHRLQELWASSLGVDAAKIGRDDSFLQLGGDSIKAMRLIGLARGQGFELMFRDVFEQAHLKDLAATMRVESPNLFDNGPAPFSLLQGDQTPNEVCSAVSLSCGVHASAIEDVFPCTPLQEGLLAWTIRHPGEFTARHVLELQTDVDLDRFRAAWELVVAETPILRTRVIEIFGGKLSQAVIRDSVEWFEGESVAECLEQEKQRGFGLGMPLTRCGVVTENHKIFFVWTIHHALYDGWMMPMLFERISKAYRHEELLPPPPFQSFVRYIADIDDKSARDYWEEQFENLEAQPFPPLPSPTYKPRADRTIFHGVRDLKWPKNIATPSILIRAAWSLLAAQYSGASEVVFGVTVIGRQANLPNIEAIMGPTIATIPVRIVTDPQQELGSFINAIQRQSTSGGGFEHVGLHNMRKMGENTNLATRFQTLLVVQPKPSSQADANEIFVSDGNRLKGLDIGKDSIAFEMFALQLLCYLDDDGAELHMTFDSKVLDDAQITRMGHQFEYVLRQVCHTENRHTLLQDLNRINDFDLEQIWTWNAQVPQASETCVHERIMAAARQHPNDTAVCAWDGELTYGQLDELSTQLAHTLVSLGGDSDAKCPVPLCIEKSMWMSVAMLAVMKAGWPSVAVDTTQPEERLRSIIQQVKPTVILSSSMNKDLAESLAEQSSIVLVVDRELFCKAGSYHAQSLPAVDPSSLLYVVFTSGSTGIPKGAMVTHRNFSTAIQLQQKHLHSYKQARVYDFPSYSFDVAWLTALHTFSAGGCLCVPSEDDRKGNVAASMLRFRANIAHIVPTIARTIETSLLANMDLVVTGGESMIAADFLTWGSLPNLTQVYGPAECVPPVTFTTQRLDVKDIGNIGRGVGVNIWLVNPLQKDHLSPIGAVGEIYIEGPLVGQGYYLEPQKTMASFHHDPVWLRAGTRLREGRQGRIYQTGDLARYNSDGTLTILGRKDGQVKIRGQRVELSEVERHVTNQIDGDDPFLVVADVFIPNNGESKVLVAFISTTKPHNLSETQFQNLLKSKTRGLEGKLTEILPLYMVPNIFIAVPSMPTTATGKVDRRRLRTFWQTMTMEQLTALNLSRTEGNPPQTEMEKLLGQLWASTLRIDIAGIGRDDSFLQLGGDSIGALHLVSVARNHNISITIRDVFEHPRLSALAAAIEDKPQLERFDDDEIPPFSLLSGDISESEVQRAAASACNTTIQEVEDVYPCTPFQSGLLALTMKRPGDYVARYALQTSDMDIDRFKAAWESIVLATPILRTQIVELAAEGFVQVVLKSSIQWNEGQLIDTYVRTDEQQAFGLGTPLARYGFAQGPSNERYFIWTIHHALYDGWLMPKLLQQVERIYYGEAPSIPPPFQAFVRHVISIDQAQATEYWSQQFEGIEAQPFPTLPSSTYQPQADTVTNHTVDLQWPSSDATPSTLIRVAWAILASQYSGSNEALFGVTVIGRQANVADIEEIVGPTNITVPLRIVLDPAATIEELLVQAQQQAIEMVEFEQTGIQNIRRINAETQQACEFQTLLVVQPAQKFSSESGWADAIKPAKTIQDPSAVPGQTFNTYALQLVFSLDDNRIGLQLSYDSSVISSAQARRIPKQFEHILRLLCSSKYQHKQLQGIDTISEDDLTDIWNWNSEIPQAVNACVHNLIRDTVQRQPDATAICAWDGQLTYNEFDRSSTALAHYLVTLGVKANSMVLLCFEKSMWTAVTMLAVMKAGGASVTLDTTQPIQRINAILEQVRPTVILSSSAYRRTANQFSNERPVVAIDAAQVAFHLSSTHDQQLPEVDPDDLACLFFTSGSTGVPKGAKITHRNLCTNVKQQQTLLKIDSATRMYDFASYAFDVTWFNFIHTFIVGGCLCVPSEDQRRTDIAGSMRNLHATYALLTPSVARLLDPKDVPELQTLTTGGEAFLQGDKEKWTPYVNYICAYGPAECSMISTIEQAVHGDDSPLRLGYKVGTNTWIVNTVTGNLAAIGAVGELYLEGPLVGAGYINDPERTAAAYVDNPAWLLHGAIGHPDHPGHAGRPGKLYKSGDLVRYDPDGGLTFVSRKDAQVKIRGQRVELGEIEHHVARHFNKTASQVPLVIAEVLKPSQSASKLLVVFIRLDSVTSNNQMISTMATGLEQELQRTLPIYMVPNTYVPVDSVPMTTTGKIDRRRLRETWEQLTVEELMILNPLRLHMEPPQTDTERQIQQLWSLTLGINASSIGREDSFLQLGGDSIDAMRFVKSARQQQLVLTVQHVFQHPRLKDLALEISDLAHDIIDDHIPPFSLMKATLPETRVREIASDLCGTQVSDVEDVFPCTALQQGLFVLTLKRPGDYVAQDVLQLGAGVNLAQFRAAWESTIAATPILRTRIIELEGEGLMQVILKDTVHWHEESSVDAYIKADKHQAFGLGKPLARYGLVQCPISNQWYFIWTIHHALYDGWLMPKLIERVEQAYHGKTLSVPPPFQAFVKHTLDINQAQAAEYWAQQFQGIEAQPYPVLPSSTYQPRADRTVSHHVADLQWPSSNSTPSTLLRLAWAILAAQYSGSNEAVFGVTVIGRQANVLQIEDILGPTNVTVPLRIVLNSATVEQLLDQVQQQASEMIEFEQVGIQNIRRINADTEQACEFQTLLIIQPSRERFRGWEEVLSPADNIGAELGLDDATSFNTYALQLVCTLEKSGVQIRFEYDSNVINASQVERMPNQFEYVLRQLCAVVNQRKKIQDIELVCAQDLHEIWQWNATVPESTQVCANDVIAQRVQQHPSAPAICAWDGKLTYEELDRYSSLLAHYLLRLGVSLEAPIPIFFEKSVWTPIAMLGVMKAGAASVVLDATVTDDRLRAIIQQVKPTVILSSSANETRAPKLSAQPTPVVVVDKKHLDHMEIVGGQANLPKVSLSDVLYVVFTSGSTGIPKGVVVTHGNYMSAIMHQQACLCIDSRSRIYDFASYAFDVSWSNLLHALTAGACLCIPNERDRLTNMAKSMNELEINFVHLTPTAARTLNPRDVPGLKTVSLIGEPLLPKDISQWKSHAILLNTYGPSECTTWSTYQALDCDSGEGETSSIGKGIGVNTWIERVDGSRKLAAVGTIGELLLEGPIVATGYFEDAEKTADSFVQDPAWLLLGSTQRSGRNGRIYRTGDLVRQEADGALTFIGRKDSQVKIRGQRVELGDIEHHVTRNLTCSAKPLLFAEVFTPRKSDLKVLAVFLHLEHMDNLEKKESDTRYRSLLSGLETKLMKVLPTYMVPNGYVPISSIPTTSSGKLDRRRLRAIGERLTMEELTALNPSRDEKTLPENAMEQLLQQLWASALGIEIQSIGRNDSFLQLGGDSIRAMRLVGLARQQQLALTVRQIFEWPRLSELASTLATQSQLEHHVKDDIAPFSLLSGNISNKEVQQRIADACNANNTSVEDVYPCTALQTGLLALTNKRPGDYIVHHALELTSDIDLGRFKAAWESTVAATPILRTRIVELDSEGLVQVVLNDTIKWNTEQFIGAYIQGSNEEQKFGLGTPLARYGLIQSPNSNQRYFIWTIHHALYDGWLMPKLIQRAEQAYYGKVPLIPPPPFQAFVKHVISIDQKQATEYWSQQFHGLESQSFPALPSSTYQPQADRTITHAVADLQWPSSSNATPSTLIRVAWAILAAQYSGSDEAVFGVTVIGRQANVEHIEDILGPTTVTVPLRIVLDPAATVKQLLNQAQQQAIEMVDFEQVGIQTIRQINADTKQACEFQTLLVVQPAEQLNTARKGWVSAVKPAEKILDPSAPLAQTFNTYALQLVCSLEQNQMSFRLSYDSSIINEAQAERIPTQFEHILRLLCTSDTKQLQDMDTISGDDLDKIWHWNSEVPRAADACIHDLIAKTAQQQPEAIAICAWDGQLSYNDLDRLSTALACHLTNVVGLKAKSTVALCFEKSMWTAVTMLAVMKAGGASFTLDMTQPIERLNAIIRQVCPAIVVSSLTHQHTVARLSDRKPVVVVDAAHIQVLASTQSEQPTVQQLPSVSPDDLACIFFTSGSTGTPKAAKITHRNLSSNSEHQRSKLRIDSTTRMYDFASYAFDVTWFNFVHTFIAGGCLCIPSEDQRRTDMAASMRAFHATYALLTPSVARLLDPKDVPELQTLTTGGEAFLQGDKEKWAPYVNYICAYGPAECSMISTIEQAALDRIPRLGHKVGTNTWIVNPTTKKLAAIGTVGELYLEGPLVGAGYINDPEKTAAAYITNPAWLLRGTANQQGRAGLLYKSGDLVRYDPDGGLTFVGRKDAQVKIRGQRVELGEIEHHIAQQLNTSTTTPLVVAEVMQPSQSNSKLLVVFIRHDSTAENACEIISNMTDGLEEKLQKLLPIYMIPNTYIPVDHIPMTATGKIDRRQVRAKWEKLTREELMALNPLRRQIEPPRTNIEKLLQQLWSLTLGIDPASIGREDSFLQLGGDSINAMRLVKAARLQQLALTVQHVFQQPRLKALAAMLTAQSLQEVGLEHGDGLTSKVIEPIVDVDDALLQTLQTHNLCADMLLPATHYQSMCVEGALTEPKQWWTYCFIDLPADTELTRLSRSCIELCKHIEILRMAFFSSKGRVLQAALPHYEPEITTHVIEQNLETFFRKLCDEDSQKRAVLGSPFTRFSIIKSREGPVRLMMRLSHAQYDAVSFELMTRCLSAAYYEEPQPDLVQFSSFVKHTQLNRSKGIDHWKSLLEGSSFTKLKSLPCRTQLADPAESITVSRRMRVPGKRKDITPATTFTAACSLAISRITNQTDILLARIVSGRAGLPVELQNAVGSCLNYVPVRVRLDGNHTLHGVETSLTEQIVRGMSFEGIDIPQTLESEDSKPWHYTQWGFTVQYQNVNDDPAIELMGERCPVGFYGMQAGSDTHCVKIYAKPTEDELFVSLNGCSCYRQSLPGLLHEIESAYMAID